MILERSLAFAASPNYVDAHAGYFTPASLRLIITELHFLGLLDVAVMAVSAAHGCEFLIELQKVGCCSLTLEAFAAEKHAILRHPIEEDAARVACARSMPASEEPISLPTTNGAS
ncbi:MAG: hypothetical protein WD060_08875 [Pirellulales bacterium]